MSQSIRSAVNPPTSLVSISPYPGSSVEYRPKKFTQDFGGIRNMVAGWEQQLTHNLANRSPSTLLTPTSPYPENGSFTNPLPSNPPTSNTPSSTNNPTSLLSSPTSSVTPTLGKPSIGGGGGLLPNSATLGIKSAREAFFSDPNESLSDITKTTKNTIDTPPSPQLTPSTLVSPPMTNKPSPRFASVDRLTGRQKIYDQPSEMRSPSPEPSVVEDGEAVSSDVAPP